MTARVIHFGSDVCYRVQVFRSAGYQVLEANTLDGLRMKLRHDEQVDAVILSEDLERNVEQAARIVRHYTQAPIILFRCFQDRVDEHQFDRVYTCDVPPMLWLSQTADMITASRALRQKSLPKRSARRELVDENPEQHPRARS